MAVQVDLYGATYLSVPAIEVPSGNNTAKFVWINDTTATAEDVVEGKYFYTAQGVKTKGTGSGGGGMVVTETTDEHGGTIVEITGTAGGANCPTFTVTLDNQGQTVQSVTCDKTYSECREYGDADNFSAIVRSVIDDLTATHGASLEQGGTNLHYYLRTEVYVLKIIYTSSSLTATLTPIQQRTSSDLTVSGNTVTAPAGTYAQSASASVASGTAGTPTATKGTVSNHSVSVTPSVTNTTGYITGSTKTGTAVTVSASELVSGNKEITANGTNIDVSTYSTVSVAVSGVNIDTKTATATASTYPVSLEFTGMQGQPKVFSLRTTSQISSSGSTTYYYIANIHYNGTSTSGNVFRIGSTRRIDNVTSGYSWSYSGSTLTITSSAASRSASPGAFYSEYELVYVY